MLRCRACGREYTEGPDEPWRCDCGGVLELDVRSSPDRSAPRFEALETRRGLWAFEEFLPVAPRASLGEGFTPLVDAPEWGASMKLEYCSPTGSFKDRGAAVLLSRAAALGVDCVVEDSSGNAGLAVATYAARAGIDAEIYVPADAKQTKRRAIERRGARVVPVEGSREDVSKACIERAETSDAWYASHAWNSSFLAGTATFAYEVAAQRDWNVPDAVVLPIGHGTLFLGTFHGFQALERAGWIDDLPRLLGAQATGFAPIVEDVHGEVHSGPNDLAAGIRIRQPVRRSEILEAIDGTDGDAIAVGESETHVALERLRHRGFGVESTSAVAPAALERFRETGVLDPAADVVVPLTGRGA